MNRLLMKKNWLVFAFLLFSTIMVAQNANQVIQNKTILWSKIENGYQVQLIRENDHEYILKTPLELVNKVSTTNPTQGLYSPVETDQYYLIPEIQTAEIVRSRIYNLNVGMPITYNDKVQREVERLLVNRRTIEEALGRSHYFSPYTDSIIHSKYMPKGLKYLPMVESSFKPGGYSRAGARGIWQFMSSTARIYGLQVNSSVDHRLDPEKSTIAALTFLEDLYTEFGDWNLSLAAYNAGPGRVKRAIRMSGKEHPTFWDIEQYLPRETRRYIPKFMAAVYVMEHVDQIGLLPNIEGYNDVKAQVEVYKKSKFSTRQVAGVSGIPENATILTYTVKSGDNLGFIAEWYDVKTSDLRRWNAISGNLIRSGQQLNVYVPQDRAHIYSDINQLTFTQKQGSNSDNTAIAQNANQNAIVPQGNKNYINYRIQSGDTLWDISRKNGISIDEIKQINNISNTKNLKPGMVIKIREKS